jgi:hypothetical protein
MHNNRGSPYSQQPWAGAPGQYAAQPPYAGPSPYTAPLPGMYRDNVLPPYGAVAGPLVNPLLRKVKLGLGVTQLVAFAIAIVAFVFAAVLGDESGPLPAVIGAGFLGLWYLLLFGSALANMIWLYQFWSWFPPEHRYTSMWRKYISPGAAVGLLLVPYFNLYWMFVVNLGIADVLERLRVQYPSSKAPAKNLAIAATVVPLIFFPAAPFIQYFFAKHVEDMALEMHTRRAR